MVQGTTERFNQMAERPGNITGEDEACSPSLSSGVGRNAANCGQMFAFKSEESSSLDEDEDKDDDKGTDGVGWLACLLCGKPNDDLPNPVNQPSGGNDKDAPHLCASCSQRFELIQNSTAGETLTNGHVDDGAPNIRAIVKLEETEEELKVLGQPKLRSASKARAASKAAARSCGAGDAGGRGAPLEALETLECAECNVTFEDAASLERHAMTHMAEHADDNGDREDHEDGAREERFLPFKCEVCTRGFSRKDKLKLHLMIHSGDKPLKCDSCGKAFLRRDHLKNHMRTHTRPPAAPKAAKQKPAAPETGRAAEAEARPPDADADRGQQSQVDRPYGCDVCHKMFSRKDNLASHMRTHTGEKPFACQLCDKHFAERCALKRHMVVHTQEKLYLCGVCGRSFARKGHLSEHIWLHDEVKPFACNVCGKSFARDRKLKSHMMTHSGERPYKCDVCDRAFARRDNLRSHQSLHFGVKAPPRGPRPNRQRQQSRQASDPLDAAASPGQDFVRDVVDMQDDGSASPRLEIVTMQDAAMQRASMKSATMQSATLHGATMQSAAMQNATMQSVAMQNATMQSSAMQSVAMQDIAMQNAAMQSVAMQSAAMHDIAMQSAAMQSALMQGLAVPQQLLEHQLMTPMDVGHVGHGGHGLAMVPVARRWRPRARTACWAWAGWLWCLPRPRFRFAF
ncbi:zinc finger protein 436-like [Thrips palmi]|uniref:Zinc finger protein 436-like n=1 Tax=Thrips palmi TaxID=161013 RepID=A0A6P8XUA3_THRPL|nr:zinc finger protein 436-like [Thrips palmi]